MAQRVLRGLRGPDEVEGGPEAPYTKRLSPHNSELFSLSPSHSPEVPCLGHPAGRFGPTASSLGKVGGPLGATAGTFPGVGLVGDPRALVIYGEVHPQVHNLPR
eukprot:4665130-Pyramimonas_sp.AAC.1